MLASDVMSASSASSALKDAVRSRKGVVAVQQLLDKGANPNCCDYEAAHKCGRGWDAGILMTTLDRPRRACRATTAVTFPVCILCLQITFLHGPRLCLLWQCSKQCSKDVQVVRALLKAGADPNKGEHTGDASYQEDGGMRSSYAEHTCSAMDIALRMGLKDIARELLGDKAAAVSESTNLPDDIVEGIIDTQIANTKPAPMPEPHVYNQFH